MHSRWTKLIVSFTPVKQFELLPTCGAINLNFLQKFRTEHNGGAFKATVNLFGVVGQCNAGSLSPALQNPRRPPQRQIFNEHDIIPIMKHGAVAVLGNNRGFTGNRTPLNKMLTIGARTLLQKLPLIRTTLGLTNTHHLRRAFTTAFANKMSHKKRG